MEVAVLVDDPATNEAKPPSHHHKADALLPWLTQRVLVNHTAFRQVGMLRFTSMQGNARSHHPGDWKTRAFTGI